MRRFQRRSAPPFSRRTRSPRRDRPSRSRAAKSARFHLPACGVRRCPVAINVDALHGFAPGLTRVPWANHGNAVTRLRKRDSLTPNAMVLRITLILQQHQYPVICKCFHDRSFLRKAGRALAEGACRELLRRGQSESAPAGATEVGRTSLYCYCRSLRRWIAR